MPSLVAETACVDPRAQIASDVSIGPGCFIGPMVTIGQGTRLISHVCLMGTVDLGQFNTLGPFVAIGSEPQDLSYKGAATRVEIGDRNTIRERVTIHRASEKEEGVTRLGSDNHLMAGAHIAHDCKLGDQITMGAGSMLAGHVHVEDWAHISEAVAILQFVTIGTSVFIGGQSKVGQDLPPYTLAKGNPATVRGICAQCPGQPPLDLDVLRALRKALRLINQPSMSIPQAVELLETHDQLILEVLRLIKFVEAQRNGKRGRARDHQ